MRKLLLLLGLFAPVLASAQGIFISPRTVFGTVNGVTRPIPNATVTVCAAGAAGIPCSPALASTVFKDAALTIPLSNPFTTDANGNYPTVAVAGGTYTITESAASFQGFSYQAAVSCAPGPCAITSLTATSATITGATSVGSLNNTCKADTQTGADMGAKIVTCHGTLPATGGIIDATGFQGNQVCSTDWANSLTKPVTVLLGNSTLKCNSGQGLTFSGSNISVVGVGNGAAGNGSIIASQGTISNFIHVTGSNVTFQNFRLDTSASACSNVNALFVDTTGTQFLMSGVYVLGATNTDVLSPGCNQLNIQGNLYKLTGNTFDTLTGVVVGSNAIDGQVINNVWLNYRVGVQSNLQTNNTLISGNLFNNVAGSGVVVGMDAIVVTGTGHLTIIGNVIKAAREHGIYLAGPAPGTIPNFQITVSGNTIFGINGIGVKTHASSTTYVNQQIMITGNEVSCASSSTPIPTTSEGMSVDQTFGVTISGNHERFCQTGIDIEGPAVGVDVIGNTFEYNNASGIFMRDAGGVLQHINIIGNETNNNNVTLGGFAGIQLQPDNGGVGGGTNVDTNILIQGNTSNDYNVSFPTQTTTAANVISNVATITLTNNPIGVGFVLNGQASVSGFTGADTIFNGTFTITALTATTFSYALVHANQTAATNGSVSLVKTQNTGYSFVAPSNGSAINTVRALDNLTNCSNSYSMGAGYTTSYLRHSGAGSPLSSAVGLPLPAWIGSTYNRTDGPPWAYTKLSGDGVSAGWSTGSPFILALTAQYANSTTGFTTVGTPNISFPVDASTTITGTCHLYYQAAATGGLNIQFTGPAAPTAVHYGLLLPVTTGTAPLSTEADAFATSLGAAIGTATTNFDAIVSFTLVNGANAGTVTLQAKSSAAAQLQIQTGSYCSIQ